jgi:hypothetical protein
MLFLLIEVRLPPDGTDMPPTREKPCEWDRSGISGV